ncbi:NTP transferase domain-containing protein, partial [Caulobacter sp.]|uniref:NTP transferase domain-containing protein n=1 Tax=Caulobacter sp. TaxID=78 RepID=UPI001B207929
MEFDRLEQAWRSEANTPDAQAQAYLMEELMHMLKARRRGETLLFAIPVAAMTLFTAIVGRSMLMGRMNLEREWGALAMLGVCWLVLAAVFAADALTLGLLAGGRGTRLGGIDKAWIVRDGVAQVQRFARRFPGETGPVLVSANRGLERYAEAGLQVVTDRMAED